MALRVFFAPPLLFIYIYMYRPPQKVGRKKLDEKSTQLFLHVKRKCYFCTVIKKH